MAQDPAIVDPIRTGTFIERQLATPVYEALFDIDTFAEVKARMTAKHGDVVKDFSDATAANILTIKHPHIAKFSAADFLLG